MKIKNLQEATMKQADSILWHGQSIGRIIASKAHSVFVLIITDHLIIEIYLQSNCKSN